MTAPLPPVKMTAGLHLTAHDRRALATMRANGWATGQSARKRYSLAPAPDHPGELAFTIAADERDDWGRPVTRRQSGRILA